jgi:hypothetical protein
MNTTSKLMVAALALAFAASVQAAGPGIDDRLLAEAGYRAELQEITAVLADPDARERYGAVVALANLASKFVVPPMEISDLLGATARDSDPEIARFASNAFYQVEMRARRLAEEPSEIGAESEPPEVAKQREFDEIAAILNDPRSRERYLAANDLSNLASTYDVLPSEVLDLLWRTRDDDDFEIARLAETVLAQREGRPIDPSFRSEPAAPKDLPTTQKRGDNPFDKLSDPNPNLRYDALVYLLDMAPKDGRTIDPEVLKAFTEATSDPDPRVRSFAEFAIGGGLAGDENALRQVFVGTVQPVTGTAYTLQQPTPEKAKGALQHEGTLDERGVFIGVTKASEGDSLQQPIPAPEYAEAKQHPGYMDEHGVFIGVVVPPIGSEGQTEAVTVDFTSN